MALRAARLATAELGPGAARRRLDATIAGEDSIALVAELDERLVGICTAYIDLLSVRYGLRCWVEDLAVDPELRSQGVGPDLLDRRASSGLREHGATHLELDSGAARTDAHRFYEREGAVWPSKSFAWTGSMAEPATRSGFIGLAGRPNVGKSTLANALVGSKVAIVSDRPQTTRRAVRAVATAPDGSWQMVLVDLPGVQKPRDVLTERMQRRVERELVGLRRDPLRPQRRAGDRARATASSPTTLLGADPDAPVICAVNKIDRLGKRRAGRGARRRGRARGRRRGVPDQRPPRHRARGAARAAHRS